MNAITLVNDISQRNVDISEKLSVVAKDMLENSVKLEGFISKYEI